MPRRCDTTCRKRSNQLSAHSNEERSTCRSGWIGRIRPSHPLLREGRNLKDESREGVTLERRKIRSLDAHRQHPTPTGFSDRDATAGAGFPPLFVRAACLAAAGVTRFIRFAGTSLPLGGAINHRSRSFEGKAQVGRTQKDDEQIPIHLYTLGPRVAFCNPPSTILPPRLIPASGLQLRLFRLSGSLHY